MDTDNTNEKLQIAWAAAWKRVEVSVRALATSLVKAIVKAHVQVLACMRVRRISSFNLK